MSSYIVIHSSLIEKKDEKIKTKLFTTKSIICT
jgi:hypothetical protein